MKNKEIREKISEVIIKAVTGAHLNGATGKETILPYFSDQIVDQIMQIVEEEVGEERERVVEKIEKELSRRTEFDEDTDTMYFNREIDFEKKKEINNYEVFIDVLSSLKK